MTTPNGEVPPGGRPVGDIPGLATVTPPAQANPDMWDNAEQARQRFSVNILSGFASLGSAIGKALEDLASALFGSYKGDHPALVKIRDGQLDLIHRLDLLKEVSGYGCLYMKESRYKNRDSKQLMEFNGQLGPVKNCEIIENGFRLARGTWEITSLITYDQHENGDVVTWLEVLYPEGDPRITPQNEGIYSAVEFHSKIHQVVMMSANPSATVICPEPGYRVRMRTENHVPGTILYNRLLFQGGTQRTRLSVKRMDLDSSNAVVQPEVPTVGAGQGDQPT